MVTHELFLSIMNLHLLPDILMLDEFLTILLCDLRGIGSMCNWISPEILLHLFQPPPYRNMFLVEIQGDSSVRKNSTCLHLIMKAEQLCGVNRSAYTVNHAAVAHKCLPYSGAALF